MGVLLVYVLCVGVVGKLHEVDNTNSNTLQHAGQLSKSHQQQANRLNPNTEAREARTSRRTTSFHHRTS